VDQKLISPANPSISLEHQRRAWALSSMPSDNLVDVGRKLIVAGKECRINAPAAAVHSK
jgi:hypothetical protein